MAESPRTAQNVDYIADYAEGIRDELQSLADRLDDAESRNIQREMITTIARLATAIENLHSIYFSMHQEYTQKFIDSNGHPRPAPTIAPATETGQVVRKQRVVTNGSNGT